MKFLKLFTSVIFLLFLEKNSFAKNCKKDTVLNKFSIKIDLLRFMPDMIGIKYGCLCVGMEQHFKIKNSINLDLGIVNDYGSTDGKKMFSIKAKSVSGYFLGLGYRRYYKDTKKAKFYLAFDGFAQNIKIEREEVYYNEFNTYVVDRSMFAFHIKYGIKIIYSHFVFDPSLGIGVRYIMSDAIGRKHNYNSSYELPYNKKLETGSKLFPSVNYNIKIGYTF